jgi:hypothetical protein
MTKQNTLLITQAQNTWLIQELNTALAIPERDYIHITAAEVIARNLKKSPLQNNHQKTTALPHNRIIYD